jgi:intermembrane space import and assembly protein 40
MFVLRSACSRFKSLTMLLARTTQPVLAEIKTHDEKPIIEPITVSEHVSPPDLKESAKIEAQIDEVVESEGTPDQTIALNPEGLEEEADQQGAFNPETGEINWDCPCLGGMAHGPCGEEFKAAFSCFVYSTEEPKGVDCIDNFK